MGLDDSVPAIRVRGVRVHNLKNVDVDIPRGQLVVVCGVSGSGKTSLAIDTLYAEGQRRYIESFSAYTRQFLERLDKPDYDSIEGLPPALAVTRGEAPRGNRSTVGTASETLDYLRLLFAGIAQPLCFQCGQPVVSHSPQSVASFIHDLPAGGKLLLGFEVTWEDVADRAAVLAELQAAGFVRLLAGEQILNLGQDSREELASHLPSQGRVWVVVDRLRAGDAGERTVESLESAFDHGDGRIAVLVDTHDEQLLQAALRSSGVSMPSKGFSGTWLPLKMSRQLQCSTCELEYPDPQASLFSFNSPLGACPVCEGFGDTVDLDLQLIVPDRRLSIREGAIAPWNTPAHNHNLQELLAVGKRIGVPLDLPFRDLSDAQVQVVVAGDPKHGFGGLNGFFAALERKKYKMHVRVFLSRWRSYTRCATCHGNRLNPVALSYRVAGRNFADICKLEIHDLLQWLNSLGLSAHESQIAGGPLQQVSSRLNYLHMVGLGYLTLDRTLRTLSGGEAQRTALTSALGSSLVNMLYVLDEPSVGLHPDDVLKLTAAIDDLSLRGNTVIMIEHEEALIERAQWVIEVGPAAGEAGGRIVFSGPSSELEHSDSLTADYLFGRRQVTVPERRRQPKQGWLTLRGCTGNNLQHIDVKIPLGVLCLVTGVSGSGKSSLVQDTLWGALVNRLSNRPAVPTLPFETVEGTGLLDDCILVDQNPISRSPRSNPITFVKAFDEVRKIFAETLEARTHNLTASHFSFNSEHGRCQTCSGDGVLKVDMQFLADVQMTCPSCGGDRYRSEILTVRYRDRTIADVLRMTVLEAIQFFRGAVKLQQKLQVLNEVGLGYLQLGQSATTLSSGEGQRLKLAAFLTTAVQRKTMFILDEPTTGLHTNDIVRLLDCFDALLAAGHSLVIVEHNLHLMAAADYIIDLGPGAAAEGGCVVAAGSPEQIVRTPASITGRYLGSYLLRSASDVENEGGAG